MKMIKNLLFLFLFIAAGWWLLARMDAVPSLSKLFRQQPVTIEKTGVWVQQVKALSQLVTVSAYDELVADTVRSLIPQRFRMPSVFPPIILPRAVIGARRLVLVGQTTTHVGINMQQLRPGSIRVVQDSIYLNLPRATVLDVILNPSGVDVFIEEGEWKQAALATLKNKLRHQAAHKAVQRGLLQQAEARATTVFTSFFTAAGFKNVVVSFG